MAADTARGGAPARAPGTASRTARVALIGTMASGKTTTGRAVAADLGWAYADNDELLRARTGRDAAELLAAEGEAALRAAEMQALRDAAALPPPVVLTVAGGAAADPAARDVLGDTFVVWLRADPAVLAARVAAGPPRPWLDGDPEDVLRRLDAERAGPYGRLADAVVDAGADTATVAARVRAAIDGRIEPWPT